MVTVTVLALTPIALRFQHRPGASGTTPLIAGLRALVALGDRATAVGSGRARGGARPDAIPGSGTAARHLHRPLQVLVKR